MTKNKVKWSGPSLGHSGSNSNLNEKAAIAKIKTELTSLEKEEALLEKKTREVRNAIEELRIDNREWLYLTNKETFALFKQVFEFLRLVPLFDSQFHLLSTS